MIAHLALSLTDHLTFGNRRPLVTVTDLHGPPGLLLLPMQLLFQFLIVPSLGALIKDTQHAQFFIQPELNIYYK
jgi:propanediol utilization protein